jgi:hypothetical protein
LKVVLSQFVARYYYGLGDYLAKRLQNAKDVPIVKALFTAASDSVAADPALKGQAPHYFPNAEDKPVKPADPNLAINGGAVASHALIFGNARRDFVFQTFAAKYAALAQIGFAKDPRTYWWPRYARKPDVRACRFRKAGERQ